jgi:phosphatidylglycerophosphatase A
LAAFALFRFFDILKPFPIRYFDEKLESGFGIMVDDVLAAIYAVIIVFAIQYWML